MTEFFTPGTEFLFDQPDTVAEAPLDRLRWAQLVFIDPLKIVPKFSIAATYGETANENELTALYADWQSRESEIGYALVERRKRELQAALDNYTATQERRQRSLSFSRARMQTVQRINATEPDTSLHYSAEMMQSLERDIQMMEAEIRYLRLYNSRLSALSHILKVMHSGGESDKTEQYCRLIGQGWRGQMKLRAFEKKFPELMPSQGDGESPLAGQPFPQTAANTQFKNDILLSDVTTAYLRHLLDTIVILKQSAMTLFNPSSQNAQLQSEWPDAMVMLTAIVELFYFCGFEIPYASHGRLVERTEAEKTWSYNREVKDWQDLTEPELDRMRRQASEVVNLLVEYPAFLRAGNPEDASNACQNAVMRLSANALNQSYGPYQFTGFARMEQRRDGKGYRFEHAGKLLGQVLEQLVDPNADFSLRQTFNTACGGPLPTLIGMANLDPKAFGLADESLLPRPMALKVLGNFWKRMGKQRPVALLGDDYARGIYAGLASIGESAPERSSLLSIHLTNVFNNSLFGNTKQGATDLLTVLMLADQIRLMDLLELSWAYAEAVLSDLQTARSLDDIKQLISSGGSFGKLEADISKRFNQKWLTATQPLWTILRGAASHAWGLWSKLAGGHSVASLLGQVEPAQALGFLMLPLADIVRLMLLFETSSPVLAERQKVDAETAARELLAGFSTFRKWPGPLANIISENLNYYFDPEIQHDSWLAFTEGLKEHLRQLILDLQARNASDAILDMFNTVMDRLEANHPTPQRMQVQLAPPTTIEIPDCEFAESDCQLIQTLCREFIGERNLTQLAMLRVMALWRYRELQQSLRYINEFRRQLAELFSENGLRLSLLSSPAIVREAGRLLADSTGKPQIDDSAAVALINFLTAQRQQHEVLEGILSMPVMPFDDDRITALELTVKTNGERLDLLMVTIANAVSFIVVDDRQSEMAYNRYLGELQMRAQHHFPDWQPEPLLLGSVNLCASRAGLALSNSRLEIDPIFQEPDKAGSARLLWTFASYKMSLALKLMQAELPDAIVAIRL